jgi:hypothetical protein
MNIPLNKDMMDFLTMFLFIFLPLILILIGAAVGFMNALYYILTISWFGMGFIFYKAIK